MYSCIREDVRGVPSNKNEDKINLWKAIRPCHKWGSSLLPPPFSVCFQKRNYFIFHCSISIDAAEISWVQLITPIPLTSYLPFAGCRGSPSRTTKLLLCPPPPTRVMSAQAPYEELWPAARPQRTNVRDSKLLYQLVILRRHKIQKFFSELEKNCSNKKIRPLHFIKQTPTQKHPIAPWLVSFERRWLLL